MKRERSYYPVFLDIRGRRCVVVGGGEVARRKAESLLERGAEVKVISPDLCAGLDRLAEMGEIALLRRRYQPGDLEGAFLAIAATDDYTTNLEVAKEARDTGALVNVVDDPAHSDFIVPSSICRGEVTIAISTAGRSPALARKIRTRLEEGFGEEYASLALLVDEVRTEVKRQGLKVNGDDWQEALDLDSLTELLKKGDREKAREVLISNLKRRAK